MIADLQPSFQPFTVEKVAPDWVVRLRSCTVAALDDNDGPPRRVLVPAKPASAWLGVWLATDPDNGLADLLAATVQPNLRHARMVVGIDHASVAWGELLPQLKGTQLRIVASTPDPVPDQPCSAQFGLTQISFDGLAHVTTVPYRFRYCSFMSAAAPTHADE